MPAVVVWLPRAVAGDTDAMNRIAAALYGPMRRHLRARLPDRAHDAVSDATQDAMLAVVRALHTCRATTDAQCLGWALTVGRHAAMRRLLQAPSSFAPDGDGDDERRGPVGGEPASLAAASLAAWRAGETDGTEGTGAEPPVLTLARFAAEASAALPRSTASIVWERAVGGASYAELAAAHHTTPCAAKRRVQRALATVGRAVEGRAAALAEPERSAVLAVLDRAAPWRHPLVRRAGPPATS